MTLGSRLNHYLVTRGKIFTQGGKLHNYVHNYVDIPLANNNTFYWKNGTAAVYHTAHSKPVAPLGISFHLVQVHTN